MIKIKMPFIKLDTPNTTFLLKVQDWGASDNVHYHPKNLFKGVGIVYYGKKIKTADNYDAFGVNPLIIDRIGGANDEYMKGNMTHSSVAMGINREVMVSIVNPNGNTINRFDFDSARVFDGGVEFDYMPYARKGHQTLEITLKDRTAKIDLIQYYTIFEDSDVIAVCQKLVNNNDQPITFNRLMSLQLDLPDEKYLVSSYDGTWARERTRHQVLLDSNKFVIDSKTGASSPNHNPFFMVEGRGSNDNKYAFNLIYSGNHKELVEVSPYGNTRILTGINDYLLNYEIKGGESFTTPQAIMVNANNLEDITLQMHKFTLNHIIRPEYNGKERPVLYNHWEGTGIDFNEEKLLSFVKNCNKVGIELFVMDDGWFGKRMDDTTSLGDWFVNRDKFPNGLKGLSDSIKKAGMQFGIWVEPEMISKDSDIYRAHPEYALETPGYDAIERRRQLMIDMANPVVQNYLIDSLLKMIDECSPDYIKWDYNRNIIDNYSNAGVKAGEYYHKFILGTYRVVNELQKRHPEILFEGCASGGGRFDLGIFFYMPQTWGSDNSNTWSRTNIQCGTLTAYPQSTFGAHVTQDNCSERFSKVASIEDRFNLNSAGAFGYEFNINAFTEEELEMMKNQISYYKEHRKLLQFGSYYCLENVFDDYKKYAYMMVSEDKTEAIVTFVEKDGILNKMPTLYKLKGLDKDKKYLVTQRPQANVKKEDERQFTAYGDALMSFGLDFGFISNNTDNNKYGGINSKMYYIKEVE